MHRHDPTKEMWMYPHVVQFESRREEFARELQLIRERKDRASSQPPATQPNRVSAVAVAWRPKGSEHLELEHELELKIERTLP